jgi:hypothetical protein
MTIMRRILVLSFAAAVVLGPGWISGASAQEDARTRLLGVWEGALTLKHLDTGPGSMEFFEEGGVLRWKSSFATTSKILWGDAEGTVTILDPARLEAVGRFTKYHAPGAEGTRVKYVLSLVGDELKGTATAEINNLPLEVSLKRRK